MARKSVTPTRICAGPRVSALNVCLARALVTFSRCPPRKDDNDDIMTFARAWTGFEHQDWRANLESFCSSGQASCSASNRIDPMRIVGSWRDAFPTVIVDEASQATIKQNLDQVFLDLKLFEGGKQRVGEGVRRQAQGRVHPGP